MSGSAAKPEIMITAPLFAPALAALEQEYTVHKLWLAGDAPAFLRQIAASVRGVVTTGLVGFKRDQFEALPKLEIVSCFGNPRGTIDLAVAKERGVVVTNTPDAIAAPVADIAVGLILSIMRRLSEGDRFVRAGKWLQAPLPAGVALSGKTCGILGLGKIGREIATRVQAFGMRVEYHGPHKKTDVTFPYHADPVSLARAADCLVVICPLTPQTRGLVDARVIDALGPQGFLINIARGAVVDQAALLAALKEKRIAGAGLDVFWDEPRVPAELITMDNVAMVPHIGSSTREVREERARKVLANLRARFAGETVPYAMV